TDNLSDNLYVSLVVTTVAFSIALAVTFAIWWGFERTLSIHTIFTRRREAFYWLAILFTFALGTAGGDLMSERMNLGYWVAAAIFGGAIAVVTAGPAPSPGLLAAIRGRAARGPVGFEILVPNPAPAEWHPAHPERHEKAAEAERVLQAALPAIREAANAEVGGFVSIRHDPMDAIEETLRGGNLQEVILATHPHGATGWLHADLPHRVAHLGLPVTTVMPPQRTPVPA